MENEGLLNAVAAIIIANGPDVVRGDSSNSLQGIIACANVWTGNDAPMRAIEMFDECLGDGATFAASRNLRADGPDTGWRECCDRLQTIATRSGIGTGYDTTGAASYAGRLCYACK